jgi:hypothetical protein
MQLRSTECFKRIYNKMVYLINKSTNEAEYGVDNYETVIAIFKIVDEHIMFVMDYLYNKKQDQRFALSVILKCGQLYETTNGKNGMDELRELMMVSRKKAVVHLKKIMKMKKTYLSPDTLKHIALLKL